MTKLTFKQYLDSKEQLRNAVANTPVSIIEYEVRKYCSIPTGEMEEDKTLVGLKPKQRIVVEWCYDDIDDPTPTNIQFVGVSQLSEDEKFSTYWTGSKLKKWLNRHTTEGYNHGYKA
jgi:hypothetical protein